MLYRTSNRVLNNGIKVIILICMDGTSQYHHHQRNPEIKSGDVFMTDNVTVHAFNPGMRHRVPWLTQENFIKKFSNFLPYSLNLNQISLYKPLIKFSVHILMKQNQKQTKAQGRARQKQYNNFSSGLFLSVSFLFIGLMHLMYLYIYALEYKI